MAPRGKAQKARKEGMSSLVMLRTEQEALIEQVRPPRDRARGGTDARWTPTLAQLASVKRELEETRRLGTVQASHRAEGRSRGAKDELRRVDKETARLKREIARMRQQLDHAVHTESLTQLQNIIAERLRQQEGLVAENRMINRQIQQLGGSQPDADSPGLRALTEEHKQLTAKVKTIQRLQRQQEQDRAKAQKECMRAALRVERLRKDLKAEKVRR